MAAAYLLMWVLAQSSALATGLPTGQLIADVKCEADPSQSYALYLPTGYTPARSWPVILGFDPGGRGRMPVERYQAAAEQYGFVVAGSNNSRNGSQDTRKIVTELMRDVWSRFQIDAKRVYVAGMSGGARVALSIALGAPDIAGVIASSAGFPDGRPRKTLTFPLFATAGTEDFNHLELRLLDRELTSPHRLAVFEGGHVWLSSELAMEAVEWMELQAMKKGLKPRDVGTLDRIFATRTGAVDPRAVDKQTFLATEAIVQDFEGLKDVSAYAARADALKRERIVRDALRKDREEDAREERILEDIRSAEARLASDDKARTLLELRQRWKALSETAKMADDSAERRLARRLLAGLSGSVTTTDPDYLKIINEYRLGRGRR